ncbi:hypothetical protein AVEN_145448-1, partial [Araneus ventricosus]
EKFVVERLRCRETLLYIGFGAKDLGFETRLHQTSVIYMGLACAKSEVVGDMLSLWCGVEVRRRRCRPRRLTKIQNHEIHPKTALVFLQNGT